MITNQHLLQTDLVLARLRLHVFQILLVLDAGQSPKQIRVHLHLRAVDVEGLLRPEDHRQLHYRRLLLLRRPVVEPARVHVRPRFLHQVRRFLLGEVPVRFLLLLLRRHWLRAAVVRVELPVEEPELGRLRLLLLRYGPLLLQFPVHLLVPERLAVGLPRVPGLLVGAGQLVHRVADRVVARVVVELHLRLNAHFVPVERSLVDRVLLRLLVYGWRGFDLFGGLGVRDDAADKTHRILRAGPGVLQVLECVEQGGFFRRRQALQFLFRGVLFFLRVFF